MIQLRHVPDELHKSLKMRAAQAGLSLSDYVLREITYLAERPTMQEILERIRSRPRVKLTVRPAQLIREDRDSR
jgi:plasmid stability protein